MSKLKAIVVEDEGPSRRKLMQLLGNMADSIQVVGEAINGIEGIQLATKLKPDVIFLDIQMPGMDGFELLKKLDYHPHIVFTTAYQEFAILAFEENAVDYLLKPITKERLEKCVLRLVRSSDRISIEQIESTFQRMQKENLALEILSVKNGDRIIPLRFEEIHYFQAEDKLVRIYSTRGSNYLIDDSLNQLEQKSPGHFIRIHRSLIVNSKHVLELRKYFNSRYMVYINDKNETVLISGKSYYNSIKGFFQL